MPGLEDWTRNPHSVVDRIFDECAGSGDWQQKAIQFFNSQVSNPNIRNMLPWLNETPLHKLCTNQVVRFRGMVQDMFDNEFYLETYQVKDTVTGATKLKPGRYKDLAECRPTEEIVMDSAACVTNDRLTYYCVSIPAENEWVKEMYREQNPRSVEASTSGIGSRSKRSAEEENEMDIATDATIAQTTDDSSEIDMEEMNNAENKRLRPDDRPHSSGGAGSSSGTASNSSPVTTLDLNFPIPNADGMACLVKLYDDMTFCLNDMIEVVGILSVDPGLTSSQGQNQNDTVMGMAQDDEPGHTLPPSLVPRLHVLTARKMQHTNPILPFDLKTELSLVEAVVGDMHETREQLRRVLQEATMGDELCAELLLCHLVSTVYLRQEMMALGKYSVNVSGIKEDLIKQEYTQQLSQILAKITTKSYLLPMTLHNMNRLNFIPKKDYKVNRLISGLLQLSENTNLIIDETVLTAGQLDSAGVQNLTAVGNLITWQKVEYDFKYHRMEQPANIPVLILSEGKSMINSDCHMKLEPMHTDVSEAFRRVDAMLTQDLLRRVRAYLTVARLADYTITEDMQKMVQEDFVESRKHDAGMSADSLHNLLILARLVAVSCGQKMLSRDIWNSTKILENERRGILWTKGGHDQSGAILSRTFPLHKLFGFSQNKICKEFQEERFSEQGIEL